MVMPMGISSVRLKRGDMDLFSLQKKYMQFLDTWDALSLWLFTRSLDEKTQIDLYNMFPKDQKTKYKRVCNALEMLGHDLAVDTANNLNNLVDSQDDFGLAEILEVDNIKEVFIYCEYKTINYIEGLEI